MPRHPSVRQATVNYVKYRAARSEIDRLNVEVRRLRTFIRDEAEDMLAYITQAQKEDIVLADELQRRWDLRKAVNDRQSAWLDRVENLEGFTGKRGVGQRFGRQTRVTDAATEKSVIPDTELDSDEARHIDEDVELMETSVALRDFVDNLS
jgi:hypothetical protein